MKCYAGVECGGEKSVGVFAKHRNVQCAAAGILFPSYNLTTSSHSTRQLRLAKQCAFVHSFASDLVLVGYQDEYQILQRLCTTLQHSSSCLPIPPIPRLKRPSRR